MHSAWESSLDKIIVQTIVETEPQLADVERIEFLDKGYSPDRKFVLHCGRGDCYLLRISEIKLQERRLQEFNLIGRFHSKGVSCPEPVAFGTLDGDGVCYSIYHYIPGESAEQILPTLDRKQQFDLGIAAGAELRKLHELPCPNAGLDWHEARTSKYRKRVSEAHKLGLTFPCQERIERFVEDNLHLMKDVRASFQHDDYHPGNLIIHDGRFSGVIDFNRFDWGDPLHDFYKVPMFTAPISVPFANGQVAGYFDGSIPDDFWLRYNLYVAMCFHSSLVWAYHCDRDSPDRWHHRLKMMAEMHDFKSGGTPSWYDPATC